MFRILALLLLPVICLAQVNSNGEKPTVELLSNEISPNDMKRNASFNLDEIKVRWKKAALENCPGVPCSTISVPGSCTSIVATPTGPSSASVSFVPPTSDGGSPITGYTVTATSTLSAPAKRKSSAIITVSGTSSPIVVTGLTFGVNYIFSVVATNVAGASPPITTTTTVTPCTLNTAGTASSSPTLTVNTALTPSITISTTGATGIGTATSLPAGVTASWSANVITISGTPTATGSFAYEILLTGGCGSVKAMGSITVSGAPACAAAAASTTPTLPVNMVLTNITHGTTSATGIGTATGLPAGVTAAWAGNVITISGTPSTTGTFNYMIPLTGTSCSSVNATGTITVSATPACAAAAASTSPTLTVNTVLTNITHGTTSATGIGTASGLPTGVTAAWSSNTITISGTPSTTGTFNYMIPLSGTSCSSVNATGTITVSPFLCGTSTVSDYDGNVYETVAIVGTSVTQCWTKSNLKVTRYNDGTLIPDLTASLNNPWATKSGARTEYVNGGVPLSGYVGTFGYLYNWYAAAGIITIGGSPTKNICPTGWHVPTDSDWNKLVIYIHSGADTITTTAPFAQSTTAGGKLKSTGTNTSAGTGFGWDPATLPSPVTDDYGFSALPGGIRGSGGRFFFIRQKTYFWSATDSTDPSTWSRLLEHVDVEVKRSSSDKDAGFPVRCLKY